MQIFPAEPVSKRSISADLNKQRIETTFQDRLNPKSWAKILILEIRFVCEPQVPI
jgi:hypothetical protein